MKVLVTGGAGFIGSALIKLWLREDPRVSVVNLDKLTYAGDLRRLESLKNNPRHQFIQGDICSAEVVEKAMEGCTHVVHLAAETHVDRSLLDGKAFFDTNLYGTYQLLDAACRKRVKRLVFVSTDEVYGSRERGFFKEGDALNPSSPYSVSKAAGDLLTRSYVHTHGLDAVVTRGANTFGSHQYPEKVIPLFVSRALSDQPLPLYGDGGQVRNWIHVEDHCRGILRVFEKGKKGEAYNISSPHYLKNLDLTRRILKILGKSESLIQKVKDRAGHDRRYALNSDKLQKLGWKTRSSFDQALEETVRWYQNNESWWRAITDRSEHFKNYYEKAYAGKQ
ncbi:MAG: dTDP-glucose 4,6-dehydratase [Candidatus Omnitrophica bacterium]|nr:dTDP-glucose 4,6-dehydratase [Candidatus Omnitrophota bacterium]